MITDNASLFVPSPFLTTLTTTSFKMKDAAYHISPSHGVFHSFTTLSYFPEKKDVLFLKLFRHCFYISSDVIDGAKT